MDHLLRPRRNARRAPAAVPAVGSPSSKSHFGRAFRSRRWRSRSPPGSMPTASHRNAWMKGARPSDVPPRASRRKEQQARHLASSALKESATSQSRPADSCPVGERVHDQSEGPLTATGGGGI